MLRRCFLALDMLSKERRRSLIHSEWFTHPHITKENQLMKGQMKVIGFEEHYGLPFIHDAALKANDPYAEVLEAMRKSGPQQATMI